MSDNINPEHYKRLPVEAIEIIESAIDNAPSAQDAYLHGQVLKYALRCWYKNGIEDLRKAKWHLDRLIEHCDESLLDADKPTEPPKEQPQPPDGWRWLEVGEVIRKGDSYWYGARWYDFDCSIGEQLVTDMWPSIRRNRFKVGEKVVWITDDTVWTYMSEINDGPNHPKSAWVKSDGTSLRACVDNLAPYIEEAT